MTSDPRTLIRVLVLYGVALPLAIYLGYILAGPADFTTLATVGIVLGLLILPLMLRWHNTLLLLSWNMSTILFFLPGKPLFSLAMAVGSFGITVVQRTLNHRLQLNPVPFVLWPLLFILGTVFATAYFNGGIHLSAFGGGTIGGKKYLEVFAAVVGFIALTANPLPAGKANFYVGLFFLGALTYLSADIVHFLGDWLKPVLLLFPVYSGSWTANADQVGFAGGVARDFGLTFACMNCTLYLIARYGIKGLLTKRVPFLLALLLFAGSLAGGFRSALLNLFMVGFFVFYLEGLFRSKYLLVLLAIGSLSLPLLLLFANRLPLSIQRSLSVISIVDIDPIARQNAETTSHWRLQMWTDLAPEIPRYFWLGKGVTMNATEYESLTAFSVRGQGGWYDTFIMNGDYHSGPLSTIIPFGIWGVIGILWFWWAALRALWLNYHHGDPSLKTINALLLSMFLTKVITFLFVFGGFTADMIVFCGLVGLSINLNNGVCLPTPVAAIAKPEVIKFRRPIRPLIPGGIR